MKSKLIIACILVALASCVKNNNTVTEPIQLEGTWQLISGTIIAKGDTTITSYTQTRAMIKVINKTHFAFLNHDLQKGKDSTSLFVAGGGCYDLKEDQYTEHLEYCSDRAWEGNKFTFTLTIQNDTLIQSGVEKIEGTEVNRLNIEKYVRVKD